MASQPGTRIRTRLKAEGERRRRRRPDHIDADQVVERRDVPGGKTRERRPTPTTVNLELTVNHVRLIFLDLVKVSSLLHSFPIDY